MLPSLRAGLQRARCHLVGARRAAQAEIDAAGIEHFQHAELLRHFERTVVCEHHAARTDADGACFARDAADEDFRARSGEGIAVVMFRQPVAMIAEPVAGLGERNGFRHRVGGIAVLADRGLVENG